MQKARLFWIGWICCLLAGCAGLSPAAAPGTNPQAPYWPASDWRASTPEEQGIDSALLASMTQQIQAQKLNLHSLLIVRHGVLVTEIYFAPYTQDQPAHIFSVTKTVIATLVGIAIQQGYIKDTRQTLVSFFPGQAIANLDERKQAITLQDLLNLTAGLKCNDAPNSGEIGMEGSQNWVQFMLDSAMTAQPGTQFNYCGGAVHLLSAILQKASGMSAREFANRFLFAPLGIAEVPENRWQQDPQGISVGPYGLYLTPRDLAKLGYLYLRSGQWGDQQILPAGWVSAATTAHTTKDNGLGYGYLLTIDPQQGSYSMLGLAGQQVYVVPGKDMVVVFTGTLPSYQADMDFIPLKALVDQYILPAAKSEQTLPANPQAVAQIHDFEQQSALPKPEARTTPQGALQYSGVVYHLDENDIQWKTLSFDLKSDAASITAYKDGDIIDPPIGLDNVFRVAKSPNPGAQAMRGYWEDEHTLVIQSIYIGEGSDIDYRIVFSADTLDFVGKFVVNGQVITLHGVK